MQPSTAIFLLSLIAIAKGVPVIDNENDLVVRAPGDTQSNPIHATIDCIANNIEQICDVDCEAILCQGKPQVLQRNSAAGNQHYRDSGAGVVPFNDSPSLMARRGVTRRDSLSISAEEYPYESTSQGGYGAVVAGVPRAMQQRQGVALSVMYSRGHFNIANGKWFKQNFRSNMPYCVALNRNPPDHSICNRKIDDRDTKLFTFIRDSAPRKFVHFKHTFSPRKTKRDDEHVEEVGDEVEDTSYLDLPPSALYIPEEIDGEQVE